MGSSNNPTNEDELLLSHVFIMTLMSQATNDGSRICQHWQSSANCTGHFWCEYNYSNLFIY